MDMVDDIVTVQQHIELSFFTPVHRAGDDVYS